MKYSLWCFLFGHKWLGKTNFRKIGDRWVWNVTSSGFCQRCGLTKEEAEITGSKH